MSLDEAFDELDPEDPSDVLAAHRRGAISDRTAILLALQSLDDSNVERFVVELSEYLHRELWDFLEPLPDDDDDEAWSRWRRIEIGSSDRSAETDQKDDVVAVDNARLRRGVFWIRSNLAFEATRRHSKGRQIREMIERLDLPSRGWEIVDYWEPDLCATGIRAVGGGDRLVYVSTFCKRDGRYSYECEIPSDESPMGYIVGGEAEEVSFEELLTAMRAHLDGETC